MRFYFERQTKAGMVARPAGGGVSKDGFVADPGPVLIKHGDSFGGVTWDEIVAAAESPGYIDVDILFAGRTG